MSGIGIPRSTLALMAALAAQAAGAEPLDQPRYPAFDGQWVRNMGAQWDASRPRGPRQQAAPLTAEYQAIFEGNSAELFSGGELYNPQIKCLPGGMPRMMIAYEPIQIIVTPDTTYIWIEQMGEFRRIYTDGRSWPAHAKPQFRGTSIGRWIDERGSGRYDLLVVETRNLKGPRTFDADGMPLHADSKTIVKERIYLDRADPNLLHDDVTTFDRALTRPYTVARTYRREPNPVWPEDICDEDNHHVNIGHESYFISEDGYLMPTRKDQPAPVLRDFTRPTD
jgi:hypothetical protein